MKFIKKNKLTIIGLIIFIVVIIFAILGIIKLIMPNGSKDLYGNRLDGIENYSINESIINDIKDELQKNKSVLSVNYDLKGKIVNFIITVDNSMDKLTATSLADKILAKFDENLQSFYDFQVFVKTNEESEIFPIIGYKHTSAVNFSWSGSTK